MPVLKNWIALLLLSFESYLCILGKILCQIRDLQIHFSQTVACLFILLTASLKEQTF